MKRKKLAAFLAYFPDLSPYAYCALDSDALCVGWLSADHPFPTGPVPDDLIPRLTLYLDVVAIQTRGLHGCPFCNDRYAYREEGNLGSAEFRVFGADDTVYAAPTLILHYIARHKYRPPPEFVAAVLESPAPPDPAYIAKLEARHDEWVNWKAFREKHPGDF